jgi:hypothetical protein
MKRRRDVSNKEFLQSVKYTSFRPIPTKFISTLPHYTIVVCLQFQGDPMNRRRDASKKVVCSFSKVPLFKDRTQRNIYHLCRIIL